MSNNCLVFIPVAYKEKFSMSANLSGSNESGYKIYLQNAIVALKSVKDRNSNVDVALITNFPLSDFYKKLVEKHGILHYECSYVDYTMPPHFTWSLAFYKIATIKYVTESLNYDYYLQLESDEICIHPFNDMWRELDHKLLTVFSPFRYDHPNRIVYSNLYNAYCNSANKAMIEKTGAGFVAGSKKAFQHFTETCDSIYQYLQTHIDELDTSLGDELYTSLYCALYPEKVARANPYVDIYWTNSFYFVSTNYFYDAVSVIHLPAEKNWGMIRLYQYLIKRGHLPKLSKIYKIMNFPNRKQPFNFGRTVYRCKNAIRRRIFKRKN